MDQDINPYRPPTTQTERTESPAPDAVEHELAGKGRRFFTLVIDYVGYYALSFCAGIVLALVGAGEAVQRMNKVQELLFGLAMIVIYYLFFEGLWGRTPGKLLMGTRVTDLQGRKPPFRDLVKRTFARVVPFEAFTFFGQTGFHDRISGTRVVRTR